MAVPFDLSVGLYGFIFRLLCSTAADVVPLAGGILHCLGIPAAGAITGVEQKGFFIGKVFADLLLFHFFYFFHMVFQGFKEAGPKVVDPFYILTAKYQFHRAFNFLSCSLFVTSTLYHKFHLEIKILWFLFNET